MRYSAALRVGGILLVSFCAITVLSPTGGCSVHGREDVSCTDARTEVGSQATRDKRDSWGNDPCCDSTEVPPPPLREFRGVWVATCGNLDWPSTGGLSTEKQIRQIDQLVERAVQLKLNAVILQIRSTGNALYPSDREPWAGLLTGKRGTPPDPYYDPLATWIEKCHAHGIELHAWLVPFIAWKEPLRRTGIGPFPTTVPYDGLVFFNPSDPDTRRYVISIYADVVRRYALDGVHIDHFFYPYATTKEGKRLPFPDDKEYAMYRASVPRPLCLDDWRRGNINRFVEGLYREIKAIKPCVKFGISPFGLPGSSPEARVPCYVEGFDTYDTTYADALTWLRNGWCDYMVPELYWKTGSPHQPFLGLLQWWTDPANNPRGRQIYAGICTSLINSTSGSWSRDEIAGQVMITRLTQGAAGHVHFSIRALAQNRSGIGDLLRDQLYTEPALVPTMPWLAAQPPKAPTDLAARRLSAAERRAALSRVTPAEEPATGATTRPARTPWFVPLTPLSADRLQERGEQGGFVVEWARAQPEQVVRVWTVYSKHGQRWTMEVVTPDHPADTPHAVVWDDVKLGPATKLAVAAVDWLGNESERVILDLSDREAR